MYWASERVFARNIRSGHRGENESAQKIDIVKLLSWASKLQTEKYDFLFTNGLWNECEGISAIAGSPETVTSVVVDCSANLFVFSTILIIIP